jgi:hypothetical protein
VHADASASFHRPAQVSETPVSELRRHLADLRQALLVLDAEARQVRCALCTLSWQGLAGHYLDCR